MIIKHCRLILQKEDVITSKDISEVEVVEKISKVDLEEIVKTKIKERSIKINQKAPIKEGTSIIGEEERKRLIGRGSNTSIVIKLGTFLHNVQLQQVTQIIKGAGHTEIIRHTWLKKRMKQAPRSNL